MKTILVNGIKAQDFGASNFSCGMHAIVFSPKDVSVDQVKALPNVFLHPTEEPNSLEIFALLGNDNQYKQFYKDCVTSYATKKAMGNSSVPLIHDIAAWKKLDAEIHQIMKEFKPWWEK